MLITGTEGNTIMQVITRRRYHMGRYWTTATIVMPGSPVLWASGFTLPNGRVRSYSRARRAS